MSKETITLEDGSTIIPKDRSKEGTRLVNVQLHLQDDGSCVSTFFKEGEAILAKASEYQKADTFDLDNFNAVEKAFLCIVNSLYGVSQISNFEE